MTVEEMSNEFDIQYNSIATNSAPSLDLYEKSVYLTRAQLQLVKNYFNPNGNKYKKGFEQSSKRRIDLKELIRNYTSFDNYVETTFGLSDKSQFFKIPENVFLIIQEQAISLDNNLCYNQSLLLNKTFIPSPNPLENSSFEPTDEYKKLEGRPVLSVIPKTHDEYNIQKDNPFKKPSDKIVWRIDYGYFTNDSEYKNIELISDYNIYAYKFRYIMYPAPIILTDLNVLYPSENLTIDGRQSKTNCQLNKSVHPEILDRAVELALMDYKPEQSLGMKVQMNQRNE